jgi:hypothetical protein
MNPVQIRPRFKMVVPESPAILLRQFMDRLGDPKSDCRGSVVQHHVLLRLPQADQHYWTPNLSLELEEHPDGTLVRGLFGPRPAVWTLFMFIYSAIGFFTLMGTIYGLSQWMLKMPPSGLYALPAGIVLMSSIYLVSRAGQRLSRQQMHRLYRFFLETIRRS